MPWKSKLVDNRLKTGLVTRKRNIEIARCKYYDNLSQQVQVSIVLSIFYHVDSFLPNEDYDLDPG